MAARSISIPDNAAHRVEAFENFCKETIAKSAGTQHALSSILDFIVKATEATGAAIALPHADALVVSAATANYRLRSGQRIELNGLEGRAFRDRQTYLANSTINTRSDSSRSFERLGTTVISPIMHGRRSYGILLVKHPFSHDVNSKEANAVNEFASMAGQVLGSAFNLEESGRSVSSRIADLTNHRAYERTLNNHSELHRKFGIPFSVALFDLVIASPEAASKTGSTLCEMVRSGDDVYQIDERLFAIVFANCNLQQSANATQRLEAGLQWPVKVVAGAPEKDENLRAFRKRLSRTLDDVRKGEPVRRAATVSIWEQFTGYSRGSGGAAGNVN